MAKAKGCYWIFLYEVGNLHIQAESNDSRLISHPLVVSLLTLKLREYASACYLLHLLLHLILLLCLTIFALTVINPKDLICKHATLQWILVSEFVMPAHTVR